MKYFINKYKLLLYLLPSIILIILTILISISRAYYYNMNSFPIIHAKVGNHYTSTYDYVLLIYLENNNSYVLTNNIPTIGYELDNYMCLNNSDITYSNNNISVLLNKKDVCSIYFKKIDSDINVNFYIKENNIYIKKDPTDDYNYSINNELSSCIDNDFNIYKDIKYEDGYIFIDSSRKMNCSIYLD